MVLEMIFQIVCTSNLSISNANSIAIIETMTSRVLDGPNLCLFTLTLVYLYSFQDNFELEDEFFTSQKVNMANKTLITLFKYFHLVILQLGEQDLALTFVRQVIGSSSEVCQQNITSLGYNELTLISKARSKPTKATLKDFTDFIAGVTEGKPKTKQFAIFADTLKKAYYTIAVKEAKQYNEKLEVLNRFIKEKIEIEPSDSEMLDNLVIKVTNKEEFDTHLRLFYDMLAICAKEKDANYLSYVFLMLIFEEISEYCRRNNNLQVLIKLFLEVQFIRFPPEMMKFRRYKSLLIKYFPFYMINNLSFLDQGDPFKEIIDKHMEFKSIFQDCTKPIMIDGIEIGLLNPLDVIETKQIKTLIACDLGSAEQVLDMLRLEIEIWENFIYQISHFDKEEKKSYQCMLRSVVFHTFLKLMAKFKKKKHKTALGNFLQNLCIHNDDLVKLILQQGFEDSLVSDAVEYIEWFHVCLLYCDGLLGNTADSKKRHFYFKLLTETIKKYPVQISKDVARNLIVTHFAYVELSPDENQVVLESIKIILETFPTLDQDRTFLIQHYKGIQKDLCSFDISYIYIDRLTRELEKIGPK